MKMDLESVKKWLEEGTEVDELPSRYLEPLITSSLTVDHIERGRLVCSMKIPPHLLNAGNTFDGGAVAALVDVIGACAVCTVGYNPLSTGVSVEINVSYLDAVYADEEIEIEARALRVEKAVAVISLEFKKKKTGKVFAQGRHTKFLPLASKM